MEEPRDPLLGAWRLRRYQDRESPDEPWVDTYGPDVDGMLVYDPSGWLSVHVAAVGGRLDSYFGQFSVIEIHREASGEVTGLVHHLIQASSMPGLLTADPARPFRVAGDTLTLGDGETWRRVCRRLV